MNLEQAKSLKKRDFHEYADKLKYETRNFIDGKFVAAKSGRKFECVNPATGQTFCEVARSNADDVDAAVKAARKAFRSGVWSRMAPRDRMDVLYRFAELIKANALQFALLDVLNMGKPVSDMLNSDVPGSALTFQFFAETIDKISGDITNTANSEFQMILRQPLGVVGCIVPWNYPLMMAAWKIAPALAAGNTVVLKPAEQSPLSANLMAKLFMEAGGSGRRVQCRSGAWRGGRQGAGAAYGRRQDRLHRLGRGRQADADLCRRVEHEAGDHRMRRQDPADRHERRARSRNRSAICDQRHLRQSG